MPCFLGLDAPWVVLDRTSPTPTSSSLAASQAGDDDAEERDDAGNDGLEDGSNTVDHGHDAVADGREHGLDLNEDHVSDILR